MHNCIISGASCYPCGAVVEKVEGTDEEFCRYLLCRRNFFHFSRLFCGFFLTYLISLPESFPLLGMNLFSCVVCPVGRSSSLTPESLLSCFPFSLCFQSPVQIPPLCCEIQNVNLGFTVYTEPFFRVWNRSIKVALLVLEQSPVSANTVLLATISKGLEKLYENGANRYFPTFWWVLAYRFLNLKFVFSNSC